MFRSLVLISIESCSGPISKLAVITELTSLERLGKLELLKHQGRCIIYILYYTIYYYIILYCVGRVAQLV